MVDSPIFALKRVFFSGLQRSIVLQNENGPCPLLAIANCLTLRGRLLLPEGASYISRDALSSRIAELVLEAAVQRQTADSGAVGDVTSAVDEALAVLPNIATRGLDLNMRFFDVEAFEFSHGLSVFDILRIRLMHAWVVDAATDPAAAAAIGRKSYNEAVELAISVVPSGLAAAVVPDVVMPTAAPITEPEGPLVEPGVAVEDAGPCACLVEAACESADASDQIATAVDDAAVAPTDKPAANCADIGAVTMVNDDASAPASIAQFADDEPGACSSRYEMPSTVTQDAVAVRDWLDRTASQATAAGLHQVTERIAAAGDGEVAALFRNNHVSTIVAHCGALYALVTDVGYADVNSVVWERLYQQSDVPTYDEYSSGIGASTLCDANFLPCQPLQRESGGGGSAMSQLTAQQVQSDMELALALQQAEGQQQFASDATTMPTASSADYDDSLERALKLSLASAGTAEDEWQDGTFSAASSMQHATVPGLAAPRSRGTHAASATETPLTTAPAAVPPPSPSPPPRPVGGNNRLAVQAKTLAQLAAEREARRGPPRGTVPETSVAQTRTASGARAHSNGGQGGCVVA